MQAIIQEILSFQGRRCEMERLGKLVESLDQSRLLMRELFDCIVRESVRCWHEEVLTEWATAFVGSHSIRCMHMIAKELNKDMVDVPLGDR